MGAGDPVWPVIAFLSCSPLVPKETAKTPPLQKIRKQSSGVLSISLPSGYFQATMLLNQL